MVHISKNVRNAGSSCLLNGILHAQERRELNIKKYSDPSVRPGVSAVQLCEIYFSCFSICSLRRRYSILLFVSRYNMLLYGKKFSSNFYVAHLIRTITPFRRQEKTFCPNARSRLAVRHFTFGITRWF